MAVQTITTLDLIRRSMYLINALAAGETPDDQDANDALSTLNEMIDGWDTQPLATYSSPNDIFTLFPGQSVYDWDTTAVSPNAFTTARPVYVENVTCLRNGIKTPVQLVTKQEYDRISLPSNPAAIIEKVMYLNTFPIGQVTVYPVPTEAVQLIFDTGRQLDGPLNLQATITMPPGYIRALRYNLAVELWPEYTNPTTDIESIKKIAALALGDIKGANNYQESTVTFDDFPGVQVSRSWDWRVG